MNIFSIILLGIIFVYFIFSIVRIYINKKNGKNCGGNCSCCSKKYK
ncbi:FeoB-associated Cys-rich membrane protein [uncultured Fusobacterium sp.]|jgi:hypothetical protein